MIESVPANERAGGGQRLPPRGAVDPKDTYVAVKREYYDKQGRLEKIEIRRKQVA